MEFSIYALGLAAAIEKYDPDYLRENKQFRSFLAHELRRSLSIYRRGMKLDHFRWETKLARNLLRQDDCQEIRQVVQRLYGDELSLDDLLEE
jgi:exonuclease VII small subunit